MKLNTIEGISIPKNNCLIKLPDSYKMMSNNEINIRGLAIDTSFEAAFHAPRYGTLVVNPDKLVFGVGEMPWETTIETLPGDTVWFGYLPAVMALGQLINPVVTSDHHQWIVVGEDVYIILPYESLVVAKRKINFPESVSISDRILWGQYDVIPLNGYILGVPKEKEQSKVIIAEKKKTGFIEVLYSGTPVVNYIGEEVESEEILPGDTIMVKMYRDTVLAEVLENSLVRHFDPREICFVQNKQVVCKM